MSGRSVSMNNPPPGDVDLSSVRTDRMRVGDHNGVHPRPFHLADQRPFDLRAFIAAIEQGDSETQIRCYADRATVQLIDPDHPPRSPKLLAGKAEIAAWIQDTSSHRMTHHIVDTLEAGPRLAFTDEICDRHGTQMVSTTTATRAHGRIVQQRTVLVWDGWD